MTVFRCCAVAYRGSPIVADLRADADPALPAPGDRVPDVVGLLQRYVGRPRRLLEFVGRGRHVQLGYVDSAGAQYEAFADGCRALAGLLPDAASAVLVAAPGCEVSGDEQMTVLTDTTGEFASAFGASGCAVWIVRPDGHIGWRSGDCSGNAVSDWGGFFGVDPVHPDTRHRFTHRQILGRVKDDTARVTRHARLGAFQSGPRAADV